MKSESSGTLTAVCMLVPLVGVPYFAIRGTQDFPAVRQQSLDDDSAELSFPDEDGFGTEIVAETESDAPAFGTSEEFPSDDVRKDPGPDWSDPFDPTSPESVPSAPPPRSDNTAPRPAPNRNTNLRAGVSGLPGTRMPRGPASLPDADSGPGIDPKLEAAPVVEERRGGRRSTADTWRIGIERLRAIGMRNHRVETTPNKSKYFLTAFFPDDDVIRRFEGEGTHPLIAMQSVVRQVSEWRSRR